MNIDRNNYEVYFLDYIDGKLSPELVNELHVFLALNPDLDEELQGIDQSVLSFNEEIFEDKDLLKRPEWSVSQDELDEMLMQEFEGMASAEFKAKLDQLASQFPAIAGQRSAMQKSRWIPDTEVCDFKSLLRVDETPDMRQTHILMAAAVEGDLKPSERAELNDRLASEPSLQFEMDKMASARIQADQTSFDGKDEVQFPDAIDYSDIRNLMIAKVEGDLNREQNERLSAALATNQSLQEELRMFYQARLVPETIAFEEKNELRRKETAVIPLRRVLTIVSSIAAVLVLVFWISTQNTSSSGHMAGQHSPDTEWNNVSKSNPGSDPQEDNPIPSVPQDVIKDSHVAPDQLAFEQQILPDPKVIQDSSDKAAPLRSLKTLHAPENAFAFTNRKDLAKPTLDMSLIHNDELTAEVIKPAKNSTENEPATIWQLLGDIAGDRLEKTAAFALVERQVEKVSPENQDKFRFERIDKEDKSKVKMKLGKLEFSRDAKKRPATKGRLERIIDRFVKE